jgi:Ser/Thr protein kinase RdoA (MazF antagonist)
MPIARRFSITNFFIATSALTFQVFVLYPWHKRLDDDFETLKKEHLSLVQELKLARNADMLELKEAIKSLKK